MLATDQRGKQGQFGSLTKKRPGAARKKATKPFRIEDYNYLQQKDRRMAGPTAPACALYQKEAIYNNDNIPGLKGIPAKYLL